MAYYLDTSAAVKLVLAEPRSRAMSMWAVAHADSVVSSDLLRTELLRTTRRGAPARMERARAVLDSVLLMAVPPEAFERAATLEPTELRSLDTLHLAAALELGDDLDAIVTYDDRLTRAAIHLGLTVVAP